MSEINKKQEEFFSWLQGHRAKHCPEHGGVIANSIVKNTCYCPVCRRIWRIRRNTQNWKVYWYFIKLEDIKIKQ